MDSTLKFCASTHTYTLDGRNIPSVTQVIRHFSPPRFTDGFYLGRGKAVHLAVQMALRNVLDWQTVDPRIEGRVRSILSFIHGAKIEPEATELQLASTLYQFAGTVDFIGRNGDEGYVLADWKGSVDEAAMVQLGAYSILYREVCVRRAVAVECRDDGTFKCHWLNRRELEAQQRIFLAMLTTYNWKMKHQPQPESEQERTDRLFRTSHIGDHPTD